MGLISLLWGIAMLLWMLLALIPLLGAMNWLVIPFATFGVILAAIGIGASVIGAFYYLKFIKVMFFDDSAQAPEERSPAGHWAVLAVCVLAISPLGYLATPWLDGVADRAAAALFVLA